MQSRNALLPVYGSMEDLYRCNGSCNTLDDICGKTCIPNKMEDASLTVFNIITGISEQKK